MIKGQGGRAGAEDWALRGRDMSADLSSFTRVRFNSFMFNKKFLLLIARSFPCLFATRKQAPFVLPAVFGWCLFAHECRCCCLRCFWCPDRFIADRVPCGATRLTSRNPRVRAPTQRPRSIFNLNQNAATPAIPPGYRA